MITLGILADTHIPDRVRKLDLKVLSIFRRAGVQAILHAGDVSIPGVLEQLGELAPVYAVQGNRDWVRLGSLPRSINLTFGGVQIGMTHGHGTWRNYMVDKAYYAVEGLQPDRYLRRLLAAFPSARVIIFGHLHLPLNAWFGNQLLFNPGSACCPGKKHPFRSIGLLYIDEKSAVEAEIIHL